MLTIQLTVSSSQFSSHTVSVYILIFTFWKLQYAVYSLQLLCASCLWLSVWNIWCGVYILQLILFSFRCPVYSFHQFDKLFSLKGTVYIVQLTVCNNLKKIKFFGTKQCTITFICIHTGCINIKICFIFFNYFFVCFKTLYISSK